MEAIIKTDDSKTFQKILKYIKTLGVSVSLTQIKDGKDEKSNHNELIKKLTKGYNLGGFNRDEADDRDGKFKAYAQNKGCKIC